MGIFGDTINEMFKLSDIYQAKEIDRLDNRMHGQISQSGSNSMDLFELQKKVDDLENKNAQFALLFRTLYDTCIQNNAFSKEEFKSNYKKIDLLDGELDSKLSPPKK